MAQVAAQTEVLATCKTIPSCRVMEMLYPHPHPKHLFPKIFVPVFGKSYSITLISV